MKIRSDILTTAWTLIVLATGLAACCNEEDQIRYFPEEAIGYYNNHDTIHFRDTALSALVPFVVCLRDTVGTVTEKEGVCSSFDYDYAISYHLDREVCSSGAGFMVQVTPDTIIEITFMRPGRDAIYYRVRYGNAAKGQRELCGQVYMEVVEVKNLTDVYETPILFSLTNGILQYPDDELVFCLEGGS